AVRRALRDVRTGRRRGSGSAPTIPFRRNRTRGGPPRAGARPARSREQAATDEGICARTWFGFSTGTEGCRKEAAPTGVYQTVIGRLSGAVSVPRQNVESRL